MLSLTDIVKRYPNTVALDGVSLTVDAGQIMALLARNGAGKTTLVSVIVGLLAADRGQVAINGEIRSGKRLSAANQRLIGFVSQDTGIYPELTVAENLRFFGRLYGVPHRELPTRTAEICDVFGLTPLLKRPCNQLSGGEKRRLHTAAALLHKPKLVLLDEPTVGADPQARNAILAGVKALADQGTAVVYTSHYFPEIEALNADITVMDKGKILDQGKQDSLLQRYGKSTITIEFNHDVAEQAALSFTQSLCLSPSKLQLPVVEQASTLPGLIEKLGKLTKNIINIEQHNANLEQAFLSILQTQTKHT